MYPDKLEFKSFVNSVAILSVVIDDALLALELSKVWKLATFEPSISIS